jgi:hypothetical protein
VYSLLARICSPPFAANCGLLDCLTFGGHSILRWDKATQSEAWPAYAVNVLVGLEPHSP